MSDCFAARLAASGFRAPVACATRTVVPMLSAKKDDIAPIFRLFDAPTPAIAADPSSATILISRILKMLWNMFSRIDGQASRNTRLRIARAESATTGVGAAGSVMGPGVLEGSGSRIALPTDTSSRKTSRAGAALRQKRSASIAQRRGREEEGRER